jgi:hypothetical protein
MEIKDHKQPIIDAFKQDEASVEDLRAALTGMNDEAHENLIIAAREQGLTVIAMDLEDPTKYKQDRDGRWVEDVYDYDRLQYSNPAWARRVNETMENQPEGARYIMLAGAAHTNKGDDPRYSGVDSILGIPSIDIMSTEGAERKNFLAERAGIERSGEGLARYIPEDSVW